MSRGYIELIFHQHIKDTAKGVIVRDMTIKVCTLTNEVRMVLSLPTSSVHITTKVLKKNYDKRPAEENDFILKHGWKILHNPDAIYENEPILYVVSMFRLPKPEKYLNSYKLIWSWKGGEPSS